MVIQCVNLEQTYDLDALDIQNLDSIPIILIMWLTSQDNHLPHSRNPIIVPNTHNLGRHSTIQAKASFVFIKAL